MSLTSAEKERILADETYRHQIRRQLDQSASGGIARVLDWIVGGLTKLLAVIGVIAITLWVQSFNPSPPSAVAPGPPPSSSGTQRPAPPATQFTIRPSYGPAATTPAETPGGSPLSMDHFKALAPGMSYAQAVEIIGREGVETSTTKIGSSKLVNYSWGGGGRPGGQITATFVDDALTMKHQFGLQ